MRRVHSSFQEVTIISNEKNQPSFFSIYIPHKNDIFKDYVFFAFEIKIWSIKLSWKIAFYFLHNFIFYIKIYKFI